LEREFPTKINNRLDIEKAMQNEKEDKDIEIEYIKENDELVLALSYDGILYIRKILEEL
jgi:hypothetical protein